MQFELLICHQNFIEALQQWKCLLPTMFADVFETTACVSGSHFAFERCEDHTFRWLGSSKPTASQTVIPLEEGHSRNTNRDISLTPEQQVLIALRFYATNNFQEEFADISSRVDPGFSKGKPFY